MSVGVQFGDKVHRPPMYRTQTKHMLKRIGEPVTIEKVEKMLALIGWTLWHRGCKSYMPVNHKEEGTEFNFSKYDQDDVRVELWNKSALFGKSETGFITLYLKECEIEISNGSSIFISAPSSKPGGISATIFLSNYDRQYTPAEEYLASLPRDYREVMVCSECGAMMNETHKLPGVYLLVDVTRAIAAPFNAPTCPKCKSTTDGDINFGFDTWIKRLSTGRRVKREGLEREHKAELARYGELLEQECQAERKAVPA